MEVEHEIKANCSDEPDIEYALRPKKYVAKALIAVSLIALFLNLSIIIILAKYYKKQLNSHYMFVFNQCLSDCMICVFTIIDRALTYSPDFLENEAYLCVMMVTAMVRFLSFVVTLLNMIAITVSRFVAVYKPTRYNEIFSRQRTNIMIMVMFGIFFLLAFLQCGLLAVKYTKHTNDIPFCLIFFLPGGSDAIDAVLTMLFVLLIVMMPFVYTYIVTSVKRSKASATGKSADSGKTSNMIITSFWIVMTFILCFTPFVITKFMVRFSPYRSDCMWLQWIQLVSCYLGALAMVNCIFDPIIYALRMPKIRAGYADLWKSLHVSSKGQTHHQIKA